MIKFYPLARLGRVFQRPVRQNGAKKLLSAQVGESRALKEFVKPNGDSWVMGHRKWLERFMNDSITPSVFICSYQEKKRLESNERDALLLDITEKLKI